jgi:hypothetical protein
MKKEKSKKTIDYSIEGNRFYCEMKFVANRLVLNNLGSSTK